MIGFKDYLEDINRKELIEAELFFLFGEENTVNEIHNSIIGALLKLNKRVASTFTKILNKDESAIADITDIGRHEFLNFLLMLDQGTLHIMSNLIHTIDAWTGWGLWEEFHRRTSDAEVNIKELILLLRDIEEDIKVKYNKKESKKIMVVIKTLEHQLKGR